MFTKLVAVFYLALNFCKHKHCLRFLYFTKNCKLLTASWLWYLEFGWPLEIYWTGIRRAINGIVEISFIVVWRSHYLTIGIVLHILFMSQINKNLLVGLGSGSISGMVIDSVIWSKLNYVWATHVYIKLININF